MKAVQTDKDEGFCLVRDQDLRSLVAEKLTMPMYQHIYSDGFSSFNGSEVISTMKELLAKNRKGKWLRRLHGVLHALHQAATS